jgi:hypothetical protein
MQAIVLDEIGQSRIRRGQPGDELTQRPRIDGRRRSTDALTRHAKKLDAHGLIRPMIAFRLKPVL